MRFAPQQEHQHCNLPQIHCWEIAWHRRPTAGSIAMCLFCVTGGIPFVGFSA